MIHMADVSVGICGHKGRQAVMDSDFAMGQFRFLRRLILVHGHWNYQRMGYLVLYNFYRNVVFVFMLFWYILCPAFLTTSALTDWSSVFYSVIYTCVPTIIVGNLDKDLSHKTLLQYPKLYEAGHRYESYNGYHVIFIFHKFFLVSGSCEQLPGLCRSSAGFPNAIYNQMHIFAILTKLTFICQFLDGGSCIRCTNNPITSPKCWYHR